MLQHTARPGRCERSSDRLVEADVGVDRRKRLIEADTGQAQPRIRLEQQDGRAVLEVRDDGCGITVAQHADPHALGLLGMRERARRMKGTLTIQGESGRGTTVRLEIPREATA